MAVLEQVQQDANQALKAGDRERAGALRLIVSELQKAAKEGGDDEVAVLQRERKRRLEAADAYTEAGRDELADSERREAELIEPYLPAQLGDDDVEREVRAVISELGASGPRDMGAVMKAAGPRLAGRAEPGRIAGAARKLLAG
jgi:uncharacterized protein YqeY